MTACETPERMGGARETHHPCKTQSTPVAFAPGFGGRTRSLSNNRISRQLNPGHAQPTHFLAGGTPCRLLQTLDQLLRKLSNVCSPPRSEAALLYFRFGGAFGFCTGRRFSRSRSWMVGRRSPPPSSAHSLTSAANSCRIPISRTEDSVQSHHALSVGAFPTILSERNSIRAKHRSRQD
jgi:hypothetical protein